MAVWIQVAKAEDARTAINVSQHVSPANGKAFTLEEMQTFVGGDIEALRLSDGRVMWLNEEGKIIGLPYNAVADLMAHSLSGIAMWDDIRGNVLVATPEETGDGENNDEDE